MKKLKVFALILVAFLTFGFMACGDNNESTKEGTKEPSKVTEPTVEYDLVGAVNYLKNI